MIRAATMNMQSAVPRDKVAHDLAKLALTNPHIIGLQEWRRTRDSLLRGLARSTRYRHVRTPLAGGTVVVFDTGRYRLRGSRSKLLTGPTLTPPTPGRRRLLGANHATVAILEDRTTGARLAVISFHLTAHVQAGDRYRRDQSARVRRHRREVARLERFVARQQRKGRDVYAMGDTNYHGLRLRGLTSAWSGHARPGTHGRRTIDEVYGPGRTDNVRTLPTASDHHAVIADRPRGA